MWPTQRILLVSTMVLLVATAGLGSYYLQTSSTISMLQSQISNESATLSKLSEELHQLQTNDGQSSVAISAELATLSTAVNGLGTQSAQQQILIQAIKSEISSLNDPVSKQVGGNISLIQSQVNASRASSRMRGIHPHQLHPAQCSADQTGLALEAKFDGRRVCHISNELESRDNELFRLPPELLPQRHVQVWRSYLQDDQGEL